MDNQAYAVPRRLDEGSSKYMVMAMIFMTGIIVGMMLGSMITALVFAVIITAAYSKATAKGGRGYLQRMLYWYLPLADLSRSLARVLPLGQASQARVTPPSHIREYVG